MGSITRYAAINSKLKAMERRFLSKEQYRKIFQCMSYEEVANYIKDYTLYGEVYKNYFGEEIQEENIQYALMKEHINNFHSISSFFNGEYKKLFNIMFMKYQFEDLTLVIREKHTGRNHINIKSLITYDSPLNKIPFEKVIGAKDVNEVMSILKDSAYKKYLHSNIDFQNDESLFRLEMSLDYIYYTEIIKVLDRLDREDKVIMKGMVGVYIDLLNLQFIYRAKKYYNLTPEEILNRTIPNGYKININKLKELCYTKNLDEFISILQKTKYKDLFKYGLKEDYMLQRDILDYIRKIHLKYKKEHKNNIGTVFSYLQLALFEIKDIISLMEAKRYNVADEELLNYISFNID
ncbi:hypothetical protein GCM10008905_07610 [Clostridium malenominatum]|uniref:V/A-type H+-transporting ATPase subunit C n=1 Tax=Clostridium malenominatum TaxID=1539 RepID=A0ABN1IR53_9CLOT